MILDEASGIFFDEEKEYQYAVEMRRFKAGINGDDAVFDSFPQLQKYLKEKHNKMICDVCFHHNHNFVMELPRMTFDEWKTHCKKGSKSMILPDLSLSLSLSLSIFEALPCLACRFWFPGAHLLPILQATFLRGHRIVYTHARQSLPLRRMCPGRRPGHFLRASPRCSPALSETSLCM